MGKSLGGEAPYGYKYVNKRLELDEKEAPIRKLIHEQFVIHKRMRTVARTINDMGHRTRKGKLFSDNNIKRYLQDPIVIGKRRMNYAKSLGKGLKWELKPKEEWVIVDAPRLISDELYQTGLKIMENISNGRRPQRRPAVYLFSGVIECMCGTKMYMRRKSPRYVCKACKNKIEPDIVEELFHEQLKNFLFSDTEIQKHLDEEYKKVSQKKELLGVHNKEIESINGDIKDLFKLYKDGQIPTKSFKDYHEPLREKLEQLQDSITELQSEIDYLELNTLSSDQVLHDARNLHQMWPKFSDEEKKSIIDAIVKKIVIDKEDIYLELEYLPILVNEEKDESPRKKSSNCSINRPTKSTKVNFNGAPSISKELVRKLDTGSRPCCINPYTITDEFLRKNIRSTGKRESFFIDSGRLSTKGSISARFEEEGARGGNEDLLNSDHTWL